MIQIAMYKAHIFIFGLLVQSVPNCVAECSVAVLGDSSCLASLPLSAPDEFSPPSAFYFPLHLDLITTQFNVNASIPFPSTTFFTRIDAIDITLLLSRAVVRALEPSSWGIDSCSITSTTDDIINLFSNGNHPPDPVAGAVPALASSFSSTIDNSTQSYLLSVTSSLKALLANIDLAAVLALLLRFVVNAIYPTSDVVELCTTMLIIDEVLDMPGLFEHRRQKPFYTVGDVLQAFDEAIPSLGLSCFFDAKYLRLSQYTPSQIL